MTGIPRNVIPSVAEGSLLHCDNQHVCTEKNRWLGAASHVAMSVLQGGSLDYARDDDSAKRYQNSAALHYFCAVPPFRISHFEFLIQAKLSFTIKWQHAPRANPIPHLIRVTLTRPVYIATVICCLCFPSLVMSCMEYRDLSIDPAKPSFLNNTCIRPEQ